MVGDGFEKDIRIPNALGMFAVWFNPQSVDVRRDEMHFTVHSMEQLRGFFETLDQTKRLETIFLQEKQYHEQGLVEGMCCLSDLPPQFL